jgi:methyltransferase
MKAKGAIEFGHKGYKLIVVIHMLFLISFLGEKLVENRGISINWPWLGTIFLLAQVIRFWAISSLGKYWNTKIIVLPNSHIVSKGPYRFIRHPNYLVVFFELLTIPLMFNAFFTAAVFTILNIILIAIRILEEEQALKNLTEYAGVLGKRNRFIPTIINKYDRMK